MLYLLWSISVFFSFFLYTKSTNQRKTEIWRIAKIKTKFQNIIRHRLIHANSAKFMWNRKQLASIVPTACIIPAKPVLVKRVLRVQNFEFFIFIWLINKFLSNMYIKFVAAFFVWTKTQLTFLNNIIYLQ